MVFVILPEEPSAHSRRAETSWGLRFDFFDESRSNDAVGCADNGQAIITGLDYEARRFFSFRYDDKHFCVFWKMNGLGKLDLTVLDRRLVRRAFHG